MSSLVSGSGRRVMKKAGSEISRDAQGGDASLAGSHVLLMNRANAE